MTELFHDIRSLYQFKAPCEELKFFIEFFSESCFQATQKVVSSRPFSIKMFKSWTPTFWINLGPSYDLMLNGIIHRIKENSAIAVTRDVISERINHPSDHLFTVKFFPGALKHLINVDQTKFNSGVVELHDLLPHTLIQKIKTAVYFEQRISLMEEFMLQRISNKKGTDQYSQLISQTIAHYHASDMKFNVSELSSRTFTSSKTLTRHFSRLMGIGPKAYFDSVRLRSALSTFLCDRKNFDPTEFGYYDKSHFYRNVTCFTGERIADQN